MSSAFITINFNRTDMTEPRRIDQAHANGQGPMQNGQSPVIAQRMSNGGKRRIDCCKGRDDEIDPAARVGDGYKRVAQ